MSPWVTADVERFNKGLSDEQKNKWVSIANGVYKSCMADSGSDKECAAKAVRIANGKLKESLDIIDKIGRYL